MERWGVKKKKKYDPGVSNVFCVLPQLRSEERISASKLTGLFTLDVIGSWTFDEEANVMACVIFHFGIAKCRPVVWYIWHFTRWNNVLYHMSGTCHWDTCLKGIIQMFWCDARLVWFYFWALHTCKSPVFQPKQLISSIVQHIILLRATVP